jgi:hypothetical protein
MRCLRCGRPARLGTARRGEPTSGPDPTRDPARWASLHTAHPTSSSDLSNRAGNQRDADGFTFRGAIRSADGADNIGTALLLELPDRAAAEKFWNEEPFAKNGGCQGGRLSSHKMGVRGLSEYEARSPH